MGLKVSVTSTLSGITRERELDITEEQLIAWRSGTLIQNAMPQLSPEDREFLISGITEEEWADVFGKDG